MSRRGASLPGRMGLSIGRRPSTLAAMVDGTRLVRRIAGDTVAQNLIREGVDWLTLTELDTFGWKELGTTAVQAAKLKAALKQLDLAEFQIEEIQEANRMDLMNRMDDTMDSTTVGNKVDRTVDGSIVDKLRTGDNPAEGFAGNASASSTEGFSTRIDPSVSPIATIQGQESKATSTTQPKSQQQSKASNVSEESMSSWALFKWIMVNYAKGGAEHYSFWFEAIAESKSDAAEIKDHALRFLGMYNLIGVLLFTIGFQYIQTIGVIGQPPSSGPAGTIRPSEYQNRGGSSAGSPGGNGAISSSGFGSGYAGSETVPLVGANSTGGGSTGGSGGSAGTGAVIDYYYVLDLLIYIIMFLSTMMSGGGLLISTISTNICSAVSESNFRLFSRMKETRKLLHIANDLCIFPMLAMAKALVLMVIKTALWSAEELRNGVTSNNNVTGPNTGGVTASGYDGGYFMADAMSNKNDLLSTITLAVLIPIAIVAAAVVFYLIMSTVPVATWTVLSAGLFSDTPVIAQTKPQTIAYRNITMWGKNHIEKIIARYKSLRRAIIEDLKGLN